MLSSPSVYETSSSLCLVFFTVHVPDGRCTLWQVPPDEAFYTTCTNLLIRHMTRSWKSLYSTTDRSSGLLVCRLVIQCFFHHIAPICFGPLLDILRWCSIYCEFKTLIALSITAILWSDNRSWYSINVLDGAQFISETNVNNIYNLGPFMLLLYSMD